MRGKKVREQRIKSQLLLSRPRPGLSSKNLPQIPIERASERSATSDIPVKFTGSLSTDSKYSIKGYMYFTLCF